MAQMLIFNQFLIENENIFLLSLQLKIKSYIFVPINRDKYEKGNF